MSLVFVPVIIIFSCGIIYIVNAIRGIPLTYTKKERGEYDCISNYFWGALMVLFMLALLIDAPDYFSGKCKDGKACSLSIVLKLLFYLLMFCNILESISSLAHFELQSYS